MWFLKELMKHRMMRLFYCIIEFGFCIDTKSVKNSENTFHAGIVEKIWEILAQKNLQRIEDLNGGPTWDRTGEMP